MITRIRALPLAARGGIGVILLLALILLASRMLAELHAARLRTMSLRAMIAEPLPADLAAADRSHTQMPLAHRIRAVSVRTGVLVEHLSPEALPNGGRVFESAMLAASGSERAVLSFAAEIEAARPAIRFAQWRISPAADAAGVVRLEARAMMIREIAR